MCRVRRCRRISLSIFYCGLITLLVSCSSTIRYSSKNVKTIIGRSAERGGNDSGVSPEGPMIDWDNLSEQRSRILHEAQKLVGKSYCYGGEGPGCFDCSGFVREVYQKSGLSLPRTASEMSLTISPSQRTNPRPLPGDLIFFDLEKRGKATHVGIVINDSIMVHASTQLGIRYETFNKGLFEKSTLWSGFPLH